MAGFLYYMPDDGPKTREALDALGFPHAGIIELPGGGCTGGPDGGNGHVTQLRESLVADGGSSPRVRYRLDTHAQMQTWHKILDGKMWLGWETDHPPVPLDLQRQKLRAGHTVTLADGNEWIVPVIRTLVGETTLPTIYGCGDNGTLVKEKVLPEFLRIWDLTRRLYAAVESFDAGKITEEETIELLCSGLAMNYRVSRWEVLHLGLLTVENRQAVFGAMIDFPSAALIDEGQAE